MEYRDLYFFCHLLSKEEEAKYLYTGATSLKEALRLACQGL